MGEICTPTQAFADSALANLTLTIPSSSLSYRTTFVTSPSFSHSSRMSSFRSKIAVGSSSNCFSVNICLSITTLSYLEVLSAILEGSSSSQSANLLRRMLADWSYEQSRRECKLIQFLRLGNNLLLIPNILPNRCVLLRFITEVCGLHFDPPPLTNAESKV